MLFIDDPFAFDLIQVKSSFDLRKKLSRLMQSEISGSHISLAELTNAFDAIQREFAESKDLSGPRRAHGGAGRLRDLVSRVDRPLSLARMSDAQVDAAVLAAIRRGALVVWPGERALLRQVQRMRALRAAAGACAGAAPPVAAGQVRVPSVTVTPSQLRRKTGQPIEVKASNAGKAVRWRTRKSRIENARKIAQGMPQGSMRERLEDAAERFERNNKAVEQARLAEHVYHLEREAPQGWVNVSGNEETLRQFGLATDQLTVDDDKVLAQVYLPDPQIFGIDMVAQVVFQGSRPKWVDWDNNIAQLENRHSEYYKQSVKIGKRLRKATIPVEITGHSLGGGLAAAASQTSGRYAATFNAAGLHSDTVQRYSREWPLDSHIDAFNVRGEIVTNGQDFTYAQLHIPTTAGTRYTLPGYGGPFDRHKIETVIDGFEAQKREDQATIVETLNALPCDY